MLDLLYKFIWEPIAGPFLEYWETIMLTDSIKQVFYIEKSAGISDTVVTSLQAVVTTFAVSLLTLKLLKKLFDIYIVSTDGDDGVSPIVYVKSFAKGLIIILCFTVFYGWMADIVQDFAAKLLKAIHNNGRIPDLGEGLLTSGMLSVLFFIIFGVILIVLYIQMLMNGVRMLVLRISIPIACAGLIDSNNGVYDVYLKKFFQTAATAVVQMVLLQISGVIASSFVPGPQLYIRLAIAIAILAYGLKVPQDLNEIFLMSAGSGAGSKAMHGLQAAAGIVRSFK